MSPVLLPSTPRCGSRTKGGGTCQQPAGWGTDHHGFGRCSFHGGASPNGRLHGAAAMANAEASLTGHHPMEAGEALEWLIGRERGMIDFYDARIAELIVDQVQGPVVTTKKVDGGEFSSTTTETGAPAAHIWIVLRNQAAERLAKFAKAAADVDVDQRRVRLEEGRLDAIAAILNAVAGELRGAGLSDELYRLLGESFRRHATAQLTIDGTATELVA